MNKEQLIALGLSEEQATAVLKTHQDSINGNYVPKATFEAERDKVKAASATIAERDTQIQQLGAFKGTAEQLSTKVAELEKVNATAKAEYEAKLVAIETEATLKTALFGKVVDVEDVIPKLDKAKIVIKEGKVESGLDDQLVELKKTKPHYFPTESQKPNTGWVFGNPPAEGQKIDAPNPNQSQIDFGKQLAQQKGQSTGAEKSSYFN